MAQAAQHRLYLEIMSLGGCKAVISYEWILGMIITNGQARLDDFEVY
jgi:hypothetical protein